MSVTIASAVDTFILDCKTRGLRPQSILTYLRQLQFFQRFAIDLAVTDLDQVTTDTLRRYVIHLQTKGLRPASIRTAGRVLRAWLHFCEGEGLLTDATPMRRVRLPRPDKPHPDCFSQAELQRLIDATAQTRHPERNRAIVLALLDTGCRINEFTLLRRCDVDLATGAVNIRAATSKTATQRTVFVGHHALAALIDYLGTLPTMPADAPLWHGDQGAMVTDGMKCTVRAIGGRAGVRPCGPHRFRRTFATYALRDGMDPKTAAAILGHSIDELLKSYVHSNDEALRAAHAQHGPVDRLLSE